MNEKFTSNNTENDDSNRNIEKSDYKNLVARLKEISATIDLLEQTISI